MVYKEYNQLGSYHRKNDQFLTTHSHFYDSEWIEAPNPEARAPGASHKRSTFAKLYSGSRMSHMLTGAGGSSPASPAQTTRMARSGTLQLFPAASHHCRITPTSTYRGNGTFTVEFPHSSLTYKSLKMVPYAKLSWKSEYTDKYVPKRPQSGYSILATRSYR